ncbi:MAG: caspase family protein [Xanthobacteraceae bacterium]
MSRGAVLVGIDQYAVRPLKGCEADATALGNLLKRHADESANFQRLLILSSEEKVTKSKLVAMINEIFSNKNADVALFYFAGHGAFTKNGGYLVTQDGQAHDEGVPMAQVITAANRSPSREKIIILDCCHAGAIDELFASEMNLPLAQGVSILAGCRTDQLAAEKGNRGLFTTLICDAIAGAAADLRGFVTVPAIYAYADEMLTLFDQRPLLKTNVSQLVPLRRASPAMPDDILRKLVEYFPSPDYAFPLDCSFEPTEPPPNPKNEAIFADLQRFRAARLVVPDGEEHLYYAAINSKSCSLTLLGRSYWHAVKKHKI